MMVAFDDLTPLPVARPIKAKGTPRAKTDDRMKALERELKYTKENLQSTIEELETSNEELKSTNEELQSTNEELQSANEELETSKEELQSLNEELVTVNTELQSKIDELSVANSDMKNLLDSTEIPTLFLDNDLCIKRFTKDASKLINLIHSDIGRPISHIVSKFKDDKLIEDAKDVLRDLSTRQREVAAEDGHCYRMRIMPYRTIDNAIDGVVITFSNIDVQKVATERVKKLDQIVQEAAEHAAFADATVNTVREPLVVLDRDLKVVSANRSFYDSFKVKPDATLGVRLCHLGNRQWDIPRLHELFEDLLATQSAFEDFEVEQDFPAIGWRKMALNARRLIVKGGATELRLLAIEDVTGKQLRKGNPTKGRQDRKKDK